MTAATVVPFRPSRLDGRSDRQVVFDLIKQAAPDDLFTFDTLAEALADGIDGPITRSRIYQAVNAANATLLKEERRYLRVARGRGYRVIQTSEAVALANMRKDRAQQNLKRGVELLRNARLDELSPAQRVLHEGQLLILSGLYEATARSEQRHRKSEQEIQNLIVRVNRLEQPPSS